MSEISPYLQSLHAALAGSDAALIQDALAETEARYRLERERLAWSEPLLSPQDALHRVLAILGPPEARAESYRNREQVVSLALAPLQEEPREEAPARPWPTFFGVFADPKAYTSLVYLLVGLVTGILYFTWVTVGLSLSLGLLLLIIGVPITVLVLGSIRALGLGEGRLVEAMLDVRMPRRPPLLPEGTRWVDRLGGLFTDAYTWKCVLYFLIHLPISLLTFTLAVAGIAVSLSLILAPLAQLAFNLPVAVSMDQEYHLPLWVSLLLPLGGVLGLAGTLHMALGLGRLHGTLARALLVRR